MKTYICYRSGNNVVVLEDDHIRPLDWRLDLADHSPNWAYFGSAQISLAILADATGDDELAIDNYHEYKEIIAHLPYEGWGITQLSVLVWLLKRIQAGAPKRQRHRSQGVEDAAGAETALAPTVDAGNGIPATEPGEENTAVVRIADQDFGPVK